MSLNVGTLYALLDLNTSKFDSKIASVGSNVSSVGRKMTAGVTLPLLGIAAAGIKLSADFEKTMNTMGAVAGVPAPKIEQLRDLAIDLGAKTAFSAKEAADGMLALSKAGVGTADIMGGALRNALDLAIAGELEVGAAAEVTSNAMNVFNLSGKESKQVVDALAGAANASSADVDDLAMSLAMGGNAAATAGLSVQETAAALAALADQGIKGSDAGTSLKTMLLSLSGNSVKARSAIAELGLEFFNSRGEVKSLTDIAQELSNGLGDLTQKQQMVALKTIFGTDAFRAANIMMSQGEEGLRKYIQATSEQGAASDVARAKMEGLPGALERFRGAIETVVLTVGDVLAPVIARIADFLTDLADKFLSLPEPMQQTIVVVGALIAALGPLLIVIGGVAMAIGAISAPIAIAVGAIAGLAAAGIALWKNWDTVKTSLGSVWRSIEGVFRSAVGAIRGVLEVFTDMAQSMWNRFGQQLLRHMQTAWNAISQVVKGVLQALGGVFDVFAGIFTGDWSKFWGGIQKIVSGIWQVIQGLVKTAINVVSTVIGAAMATISAVWSAGWNAVKTLVGNAWNVISGAIKSGISAVLEFFRALPGQIRAALGSLGSLLLQAGRDLLTGLINGIKSMVSSAVGAVKDAVGSVVSGAKSALGISSPSKVFAEIGRDIGRGLAQGIGQGTSAAGRAMTQMVRLVVRHGDQIASDVARQVDQIKAKLEKSLEAKGLTDATRRALKSAADSQINALKDFANRQAGIVRDLERQGERIADRLESLKGRISEFKDSVRSGFDSLGDISQFAPSEGFGALDVGARSDEVRSFISRQLNDARTLANALGDLASKGLNQDLLSQIASEGTAGLDLAHTLLADTSGELIRFANESMREIGRITEGISESLSSQFFGEEIAVAQNELLRFANAVERATGVMVNMQGVNAGGAVIHKHYHLEAPGTYMEPITNDALVTHLREIEILEGAEL